ncbi:MAG TPA: GTP-binding protein [Gemmataceae bacterium]|jgi:G3E family GTPase
MKHLRFIMVGGFLGAGKTTTLARLGRYYLDRGQKVGLVTNDQAQDLVDTTSLRSQGFAVEEVPGACFCCRFNDLVGKVEQLQGAERPDVILAEPVGSCTDLVATVVQPLKDLYGDRFEVGPYPVLFKPSHGLRILQSEAAERGRPARREEAGGTPALPNSGFSPKAAYIFRKQLEEADAIVINRIDELDAAALAELTELVRSTFPGTPMLQMSAKTGQGFEALTALLDQRGTFGRKILDIDYDTYAEGEAELGWLNSSIRVSGDKPFALDDLLLDAVGRLQDALGRLGGEVAHLKAIGLSDVSFGVANLVSSKDRPELSLPARGEVTELDLIVNARVAIDPETIAEQVRQTVTAACAARGATAEFHTMQSFRPGRPQPTHRYATAK